MTGQENALNLARDINQHILDTQQTQKRVKLKKSTKVHCCQLQKSKGKGKLLKAAKETTLDYGEQ
jgi:hypothetical protein